MLALLCTMAMVDVGSSLQKLEKSEKVRAEVEQKLQLLEEKTVRKIIGMLGILTLYWGICAYIYTPVHMRIHTL